MIARGVNEVTYMRIRAAKTSGLCYKTAKTMEIGGKLHEATCMIAEPKLNVQSYELTKL